MNMDMVLLNCEGYRSKDAIDSVVFVAFEYPYRAMSTFDKRHYLKNDNNL